MIARILTLLAPWLKWWRPAVVIIALAAAYWAGRHGADVRCEADKAKALRLQLAGVNDELIRLNGIATSAEARRAAIENRNRELQRSLSHEATKALDACPVPHDVLQAIAAGRVRPAPR